MKFQFLSDELLREDALLNSAMRIMLAIAEGWHAWEWPDPEPWRGHPYFAQNPLHFELALKSFASEIAYGSVSHRTVYVLREDEESAPKQYRLRAREAAAIASQPLSILVESRINDGAVLWRMIKVVDPDLATQFLALNPPVVWAHGGGNTELERQMVEKEADAAARGLPVRAMGVVDSDARFPGHADATTTRVVATGARLSVVVHVLGKRAIENYISDRMLALNAAEHGDIAPKAQFLATLSRDQRDHFPIKTGIDVGALAGPEAALYAGVDPVAASTAGVPRLIEYVVANRIMPDEQDMTDRYCWDDLRALSMSIREEL